MKAAAARTSAPPRDPLAAVPVVPRDVRSAPSARGLVLERRVAAEGRVGAFVERALGLRRTRRFELDELGTAYFRAVDGVRTLSDIARELASTAALPPEDARRAVRAFTETLVSRGLLALRLDD